MPRCVPLTRHPARLRLGAALATFAALAAGCSSDAPSAPDQGGTAATTLDVGQLFGELTLPAVPAVGAGFTVASPTITVPTSCPYVATSQLFVCPPVTSNGLTIKVSYALLDAAGKALSTPDAKTAASMRTVTTVDGTVTLPASSGAGGTFTVTQRQDLTLSGLLTSTHRLDGTSTAKVDGSIAAGGSTIPVSTTMTQTISGVVLPTGAAASGAQRWPTAGTITMDLTTSAGGSVPTGTTRMVMTFDGTSTVTLTITTGGVTRRCTLNLASPSAAPACTG